MNDPKKQPDTDAAVFDDVTEDPADVEVDPSAVLPSQQDAPDVYFPQAP